MELHYPKNNLYNHLQMNSENAHVNEHLHYSYE